MLHTGLVSVTFRQLKAQEIIQLVTKAGMEGIEWGGDIHVPHGNIKCASEVGKMTEEAGLCVAAYGSYYRAGCADQNSIEFDRVLETAVILKAPTIRIWAGDKGSGNSDEKWRHKVIEDSRRIAAMAESAGITISFEYHEDTLTDTPESAYNLYKEINHKNIRSYWQRHKKEDYNTRLSSLDMIAPWLSNVHVFSWINNERTELSEGLKEWQSYIDVIKKIQGDRFVMVEFVKNNHPECFLKDAAVLKSIIG